LSNGTVQTQVTYVRLFDLVPILPKSNTIDEKMTHSVSIADISTLNNCCLPS